MTNIGKICDNDNVAVACAKMRTITQQNISSNIHVKNIFVLCDQNTKLQFFWKHDAVELYSSVTTLSEC